MAAGKAGQRGQPESNGKYRFSINGRQQPAHVQLGGLVTMRVFFRRTGSPVRGLSFCFYLVAMRMTHGGGMEQYGEAWVTVDSPSHADPVLLVVFHSMESFANALTNVTAFGLYSFAGLLLLPAVFATPSYPRWLAWLGSFEWGFAALVTVLLVFAPGLATVPLLVSFALFAPWVWGSAVWLLRRKSIN